ncbi:MmoB/DmpM family protein [Indioceanicola profundi]|uniref:MmoB/DmpM family protein n=1 Tax=Indioceanicola profundi TaxID=2220096 RepID=UPI000E6AD615|nr:MmoB/DmpM family protein [Indioceanicola profundi]
MSVTSGQQLFKPLKDIKQEQSISHQCGVTMNDSVEARCIAEVMEQKPGISVTYLPAMIRIDGEGKIEFKMNEISEALGREMTPHLFEISTSTHYGRMVMVDEDTIVLFGNMDDALAYE